jgi:glycosyltransferase involved in cell wall biosynthesis
MLLTIITINYNNAAGLCKTVESVVNQTSHDFEYMIVDGASTDGSNELICQYANMPMKQPFFSISEPDTGIYNAMNKGIRMAKGDYIHFLNSGDWLVDENVVENMLSALTPSPQGDGRGEVEVVDILVGNVISVRPDGKRRYKQNTKEVSLYTFYRGTIEHTSAYIRRALFEQYGLYDESLKIVSDWKWYLQVAGLRKANVKFTDIYVTCFDTTGISSTNLKLDKAERRQVLEELLPAPILADYDKYSFDIEQMQRLKKYPVVYKMVWFVERLLFKLDKWVLKNREWK